MNKLASVTEWTSPELFGIAAAGGAGGFGGIRLLTEMIRKIQGQKTPDAQKAVQLMMPNPNQQMQQGMPGHEHDPRKEMQHDQAPFSSPKTAFDISTQHSGDTAGYISSILPLVAGVPAGFLGAKWMYDKHKGSDLDKQTEQAKQQYMQELAATQAKMKMGSATPCVDRFCEAVANELNASL